MRDHMLPNERVLILEGLTELNNRARRPLLLGGRSKQLLKTAKKAANHFLLGETSRIAPEEAAYRYTGTRRASADEGPGSSLL